jgi:predicted enzyme related to lactoylglutathione lyase
MGNPVVHFEVMGKDIVALQNFYKAAFDWEMQSVMPSYTMVKPNAPSGINGGIGTPQPAGPSYVTFYVEVPDVAAGLAKIEKLGGKKVMGPMDVPGGPTIALFTDPEGHMIGLLGTRK